MVVDSRRGRIRRIPLLATLIALMVGGAGCLGAATVPPGPPLATGPEPETVVTGPSGFVMHVSPMPVVEPPTDPRPIGLRMEVQHLVFAEVPITRAFAERGLAHGLAPQPYLLASGGNEGVTAMVVAFQTTDETVRTATGDARHTGSTHLWTALVVDPAEELRLGEAALHLVLLDAFSSGPHVAAALDAWSPATRVSTEHTEMSVNDTDAMSIVQVHGPRGFRVSGEHVTDRLNTSQQAVRIFGVEHHQVTGMVDLGFDRRVRQSGHAMAMQTDPDDVAFPPAAGIARLERPVAEADTYTILARYTPHAPPVDAPADGTGGGFVGAIEAS